MINLFSGKVKESKTGGENREDRAKDRGNDRKEKDKRDKKDSKGKSANSTDAGEQQDVVYVSFTFYICFMALCQTFL